MIMEAFYPLHEGNEEGIPLQGYSWFLLNEIPRPMPSRKGLILQFSLAIHLKRTLFPFPRFRSPSSEEKFQGR
jgi:hypothetical protein